MVPIAHFARHYLHLDGSSPFQYRLMGQEALVNIDQNTVEEWSTVSVNLYRMRVGRWFSGGGASTAALLPFVPCFFRGVSMMAPEMGPNRLNMKFTDCGRKVVIHLVRGLPPKISRDKKTITITFPEQRAIGRKPTKK